MRKTAQIKVYGAKISYFTGKLEGYLRYKEIPYTFQPMTSEYFNKIIPEKTGAQQMPAVELADGRWMTDTTPIIDWFEQQHSQHPILPEDPVQAFVSRLIEDYADEWLWRPAMHYRWSYYQDRLLLGASIVEELFYDVKAPAWLKRWKIRQRQQSTFVKKDGVTALTQSHVEQGYLRILERLEAIFQRRSFILGERPTLADFGLFGPMFRHFSQDPTPAEIMRRSAPAVFEWVARMWNARCSRVSGPLVTGIPEDLYPLLAELGATHLPNLVANALAWQQGEQFYKPTIQGVQYLDLPVSQYRVWCLERLQSHFDQLDQDARETTRVLLDANGCWESLWKVNEPGSKYDLKQQAPFGVGLKVYPVFGA